MKFLLLISIASLFSNCTDKSPLVEWEEKPHVQPYNEGIRLMWDYQTLTNISGSNHSFYPRMITITGGIILTVYESEGSIKLSRSIDNSFTWADSGTIAKANGIVRATVPEIIELNNGEIIVAYNTRPPQNNDNEALRFGIKVIKSSDKGLSWSDPIFVYEGGYEWNRGVWEPVMIHLDDELLLFFANEHPYSENNDQEISFVGSNDNGISWTDPQTVSYREGYRDGMPVPVKLENSNEILIAIEDNGIAGTEFKPSIIGLSSREELGNQIVPGDSKNRWRALHNSSQLADHEYGGAPYLVQIPSGDTILSFQTTKGRDVAWNHSTMAVAIGDHAGRNFSRLTEPFRVGINQSALWGSLMVKNDSTVTAITSTDEFNEDGIREVYSIDGHILPEIDIPNGNLVNDSADSFTDMGLKKIAKIGAYTPVTVSVYALRDSVHLYIGAKIKKEADDGLFNGFVQFDSFRFMVASSLLFKDEISTGTYSFTFTHEGEIASFKGVNGEWVTFEPKLKMNFIKNDENVKKSLLSIPLSEIGIEAESSQAIGVNATLKTRNLNHHEIINETLGGNLEFKPSTWNKAIVTYNNNN